MTAPVPPLTLMDLINVQHLDLQYVNITDEHIAALNEIRVNENVSNIQGLTAIITLGIAISPFVFLKYHYGKEFKM